MDTLYVIAALLGLLALGWFLGSRYGKSGSTLDLSGFGREAGRGLVGLFVLVIFAATLWATLRLEIPTANKDVVMILIGQVSGAFITVVGYYLGTSKSSADKTAVIKSLAEAP